MPEPTEAELRQWLVAHVAEATGRRPDRIPLDRPVTDLGLSSVRLVSMTAVLADWLGRPVSPTIALERPTLAELAAQLADPAAAELAGPGDERRAEPIAVVGIGCRLPGGVDGPEAYWDLLAAGRDAVTGRDGQPGGFLADVTGFDAEFFGITPREAELMDPQQRLLAEVAWAALRHAGLPPSSLRGTETGVYVGLSALEYGHLTAADRNRIEAWTATGAAASILANRLSYLFDLRGPSITVDTACSSSLVAVHQAGRALADREMDTALVGGVNLVLTDVLTTAFDRAGLLAADHRCKSFDAAADGIVRGEGCVVVVLRRLADARRDGSRVLAVIRGSAVNSDGRSNGLMAPNPLAQKALLRKAYAVADLDVSTVDYVEAHGTGTRLGDPVEADALGTVLGSGRSPDRPLLIGSVKSNIGHPEGAAGLCGLAKVVLALAHDRIPPSLHFHEPNPDIELAAHGLDVVTAARPWPRYCGAATAGVSAFGFGGTNAHVVLEEWPGAPAEDHDPDAVHAFVLSARQPDRLADEAARLADWLDSTPTANVADVAYTLARRVDHEPYRVAVVGAGRERLARHLRSVGPAVRTGAADRGVVFVFSGLGSQHTGMARDLLAAEPAFAKAVAELDPLFLEGAGFSLLETLTESRLGDLTHIQLTLFGVQLALAALWRSVGVEPTAVIGSSMGEVAAAVVAGALDVPSGIRVMAARALLLSTVDSIGAGAMAVVELTEEELAAYRDSCPEVAVAVHAAPGQLTVSGPAEQVDWLVAAVEATGRLASRLRVGVAGHSPAVDPLLAPLRSELDGLVARPPGIRCYSTVEPEATGFDAEYWVANLRRPVRFAEAVDAALTDGFRAFLEISPHPISVGAVERNAHHTGIRNFLATGTLRRQCDDSVEFTCALARLHLHGHKDVLRHRYPEGRLAELPPPVWRHRRFWVDGRTNQNPDRHPLLGAHVPQPGGHAWHADIGTARLPWLADHQVHGEPVLPGAAYAEMALTAAAQALGRPVDRIRLHDMEFEQLLPLTEHTPVTVTVAAGKVEVFSVSAAGEWTRHAVARLADCPDEDSVVDTDDVDSSPVDVYARFASMGMHYGPAFRGVVHARSVPGRATGLIRLPAEAPSDHRFRLHPALGDAALQLLVAAAPELPTGSYLPVGIGAVRCPRPATGDLRCTATVEPTEDGNAVGWVTVADRDGRLVARLDRVQLRRVEPEPVAPDWLRHRWEPAALPSTVDGSIGTWTLLGEDVDVLKVGLVTAGHDGVVARPSRGVVLVLPETMGGAKQVVSRVLDQVREFVADGSKARLWLVTRGAHAVLDGEHGQPDLACVRGLVRVLAFEHPQLRVTQVDLGPVGDSTSALLAELLADDAEDEIALRGDRRFVGRVVRTERRQSTRPVVRDGAYLITGGLGGLGLLVAEWLAAGGATRIVLAGRRSASPEVLERLRGLETEVVVVQGDVTRADDVAHMVAQATEGGLPLRGVLHAAAEFVDGAATEVDPDGLRRVWAAKATGALLLHEATVGQELDWWLVFSSVAALVGSPGQAAYAAANAWTDALVCSRRAQGLPGTSIQWGAWAEVGAVAARTDPALARITPAEGLRALAAVIEADLPCTGVARLAIETAAEAFPALRERPFLRDLLTGRTTTDAVGRRQDESLDDYLLALVERITGYPPGEVSASEPLTAQGLDSLMAVRLRNAVERDTGVLLPVTLLLRGAGIADIAQHLAAELAESTVDKLAVGPRDAAERLVAGEWRAVLGDRQFDVTTDFFTLGGNAELAERVTKRLTARLGRRFDPATLFAEPTVERIADLVREHVNGPAGSLTRVLRAGPGTPLWLFHPAGGPTSVYQPLVERLPEAVPCQGFERIDDVPELADRAGRYVRMLRAAQPTGPYRLAGWSFGGCLAYEVAGQLTAAGERVDLVAMIDSILPLAAAAGDGRHRRFVEHIENSYGVRLDVDWDRLAAMTDTEQAHHMLDVVAAGVPDIGPGVLRHQLTSYLDALAAERYRPAPYAGRVVLYRATEHHSLTTELDPRYLRTDEELGWRELCADLTVVPAPGDHISVIDPPGVHVIAAHLGELLKENQ